MGLNLKHLALNRPIYGALLCTQAAGVIILAQASKVLIEYECPFRAVLGIQCPGCGSSRCIRAIAGGDFIAGLRHNSFLTLAIFGLALFGLLGFSSPKRASNIVDFFRNHRRTFVIMLVIATIVFTISRNLISNDTIFAIFSPYNLWAIVNQSN